MMRKKICITIGLNLLSAFVLAQRSITLQTATDTALRNNLTVKTEKLKAEYQQKLIKSAKTLPPANVIGEFGQMNSYYTDTKFGISQTISFPKVYASNRALLTEEWKSSVLNVGIKEALLKRQVAEVYYQLLFLQQKKKLLQRTDSLFVEFLDKANLRFKVGESNVLEKATAENQRGQISLQLSQLEQDIELLQLQFQLLLNTTTVFMPNETEQKINFAVPVDTSLLQSHPSIQYLKQQQQVAFAETQVEKSKLQPDISFGYNLMSMRGTGANNKTYNSVPQFHAVQIGLGIPIFTGGQKAKINSAQAYEKYVASEYEAGLVNLESVYKKAITQYQKSQDAVRYFETSALKNANLVTATANKQFINGDINYLEWVVLVNQAISVQNDYIEAIRNLNESVIQLNYITNK